MKLVFISVLTFFFCANNPASALPLSELDKYEKAESGLSSADRLVGGLQKKKQDSNEINSNYSVNSVLPQSDYKTQSEIFTLETSTKNNKNSQVVVNEGDKFYLFEQEEVDVQKPGLELYQTLIPMLSPEIKKDAKKAWTETAGFREAVDFFMMESDSEESILQQPLTGVTSLKGKALEEISNKNLPSPGVYDNKEADKIMVRALYDDLYDLLINAFLIIAGVLILGKIISLIVQKIITSSEKRKKRKARRHSRRHTKRHRRKRRRTYA